MNKICIIGVGLIGGSFALGLKSTKKIEIVGFGRSEAHLQQAQKLGVIDAYSLDIVEALSGVELVLIATPVNSFKNILECALVFFVGVRITSLLLNNTPSAASTPLFSLPAIGCAGTKFSGIAPKTSLAVAITLPLVLPTSETIVCSPIWGFIISRIFLKLFTGVAISTNSTPDNASTISKL
jgi:hypothetical protein